MKSLFLILIFFDVTNLQAQWSPDSTLNNPICTATDFQYDPCITDDGNGGAIIVWDDRRSGTGGTQHDIYSQRIDADGYTQWTEDGVQVCGASEDQTMPQTISDGSDGAIIIWEDRRNTGVDMYAQKINSTGVIQWAADGVPVCLATNQQFEPQIISDENGGAIIAWKDYRSGLDYDIYAQHVDVNGNMLWTVDGVAICTAINEQSYHQIITDGSGGAFVAWQDKRSGAFDIYAQRIDINGNTLWQTNGVRVCTEANDQRNCQLISDGTGGAFIVWRDIRNALNEDIYAQRIDQDGNRLWDTSGVAVCQVSENQYSPQIISDLNGGAIICWEDYRLDGAPSDIYAQRIDGNGNEIWTVDGVEICTADNMQNKPFIVNDESSGAIIVWQDHRKGTEDDVYAQRINSDGIIQWTQNGVAISVADNDQSTPHLVKDSNNGAIIVWRDHRNSSRDIYASLIQSDGHLAGSTSEITDNNALAFSFKLSQNFPNPFNPVTSIQYSIPQRSNVTLKVYDVLGNEVKTLVNEEKDRGVYSVNFDASGLASGMYLYRLQAGSFVETKKMILLR